MIYLDSKEFQSLLLLSHFISRSGRNDANIAGALPSVLWYPRLRPKKWPTLQKYCTLRHSHD